MVVRSQQRVREEYEKEHHRCHLDHTRDQEQNALLKPCDILLALGQLGIDEPEPGDGAQEYDDKGIYYRCRDPVVRQITVKDQCAADIAQEVEDVAKDDVDEELLFGKPSYRTHLPDEHHKEDHDADDIRLDIKHYSINFHTVL